MKVFYGPQCGQQSYTVDKNLAGSILQIFIVHNNKCRYLYIKYTTTCTVKEELWQWRPGVVLQWKLCKYIRRAALLRYVICFHTQLQGVCCLQEMMTSIVDFYAGRTVLVTGATGFMGKVLLEKLLRSCPTITKIYILIRPKKGFSVEMRLTQLLESKVR